MGFFKSSLNILAVCGGMLTAGLIFLVSGVLSYFEYADATDIYDAAYEEYLVVDEPVTGNIWSVECSFAESKDYYYALIPVADKDTYKISEDIKFVVYCYDNSKKMAVNTMIDYWNGEIADEPESIEFCGIVSQAGDDISESVYAYFEEEYSATREEADLHYLPYVITDIESFSYAYVPKILVGSVLAVLAVSLYYFLIIKKEKDNKVFTEEDIPEN